ncbi:MAG TPA: lactonase family protein [Caldilineaceae bacterium]|nr:lactonase family protein [Caldilineaceae bacterium]
MSNRPTHELLVYIGTYTRRDPYSTGKGDGIYLYRLDLLSGALTFAGKATETVNPSFLAFDPERRYLYCVNEVDGRDGKSMGAVSAFAMDPASGKLALINQQSTQGTSPCHLVVDATRRYVLVANYGSGSVCVLPILESGGLGPIVDFVQHEGSSINPQRQQSPHPHSVNLNRNNRLVYVPDLGLDKIMIYELDGARGKLTPYHEQPWARTKSGAGPRHLDFHPNQPFVYVVNELDSTVTVFALDQERGTLKEVQTVSALPADFSGKSTGADIHVHPSGRFLYSSNRGHDSIAIFGVDESSGRLTPIGHTPSGGRTPRNFAIDPTGAYLLAANQQSDSVVIFRIDAKSGRLTPTEQEIQAPTPVCIKLISLSA